MPLPNFKKRYPFRLGTTSFILPDSYLANVRYLAPCFGHIELLFLESKPESLPSRDLIRELAAVSRELDVTYSVHLPTDLDLGALDPEIRASASRRMCRMMDRVAPLKANLSVLHLNPPQTDSDTGWHHWQDACAKGLAQLPQSGRSLAVENLFYPFEMAEPLIQRFDLSVCMDVGHLVRQGARLDSFYRAYVDRIAAIHLQGADNSHEHLALDRLSDTHLGAVRDILHRFKGLVTLEVFDADKLTSSLDTLASLMASPPDRRPTQC